MMQEVSSEEQSGGSKLEETQIVDQLKDAALTDVTQALAHAKEGTPPRTSVAPTASSSSPLSTLPPPSELPPQLSSPGPLPPTAGGFVPGPGLVSTTPLKHSFSPIASTITPTKPPFDVSSVGMSTTSPLAPPPVYTPSPQAAPLPQYNLPPSPVQTPIEASSSIDLQDPTIGPVYPSPEETKPGGLFGWFSGRGIVSKVMEKTKSSVETMITTLDPGMKEVIYSGGHMDIVVTSTKDVKVAAVRQAFQEIFGKATITGMDSQPSIAPQPVGFTAGLKGAEERIENLKRSESVHPQQVVVSIENFIAELLPDRWFDVGCLLLKDRENNIEVQTFSQAVPVPSEYIERAQDQTPADYNLRWSGLAVTVGQVINQQMPFVDHADWQQHFTGVSRQQMLYVAAKTIAGMYRQKLPYTPPTGDR